MANAPSRDIQEAFVAPTTEIVRRVELYDYDGVTPFRANLWPDILIGGSVSADQGRDERRSLDLELDNFSGLLDPEVDGLWYDKVIKVFYGLRLSQEEREPKVLIVEEYESVGQALLLKRIMAEAGISVVHYNPQVESYAEVEDFDILVSISSTYTRKLTLLTTAFEHGKSILTFGQDSTASQLPYIINTSAASLSTSTTERSFERTELVDPAMVGWDNWVLLGPHSYRKILSVKADAVVLANTWDQANGFSPGIVMRTDPNGNRWIHVLQNDFADARFEDDDLDIFVGFMATATDRLDYYAPKEIWETQIGEFVPDEVSDADSHPARSIKVTGRDYTARCLGSELTKATAFGKNEPIESVIRAVAVNAGIRKFNLPATGKTLGKDMTWERGTNRWQIIKDISLANNYEVYFNATGFLTLRPQQDPLTTPPELKLETGIGGNLVSRSRKTSGASIKNYVTVVGESSDTTAPLVYGEAKNTSANSPTSIQRLGDRTRNETNSLVTSNEQAKEIAEALLAVSSLQEYELSFESVLFPWIEPGEIVEMMEDDDTSWGPARYLLSTLTLPLDLGPMSGTGKRIVKVG